MLGLHCNVTKEEDVAGMIREAAEFGGRIDLLFNNAGAGFGGAFDQLTNDDWAKAFALNFYGALYGVRAVLPIMRRAGRRAHRQHHFRHRVLADALADDVSATKAALNGLTLALRYELWDENIRVTSATPGTTVTAILAGAGAPLRARNPREQSAQTILAGVAKNERLVFGDQSDARRREGLLRTRMPRREVGQLLAEVARKRRAGEMVVLTPPWNETRRAHP